MLNVASHKIAPKKKLKKSHDQSDAEVAAMTDWIKKKTRKMQKGERSLSYGELEKVLRDHNIYFENHRNNYVDLVKRTYIENRTLWFAKKERKAVVEKIANIPYWPGREVGKNLVKSIRKQASLTYKDGVDSDLFYGRETLPDSFIQKYKKTLTKLAKT